MLIYRDLLNKVKGKKEILEKQKIDNDSKLIALSSRAEVIDLTQALIQKVAQETQEMLTFQLQDIVQMALDTCFPDMFQFKVDFVIKRGKTECNLSLTKDGYEVNPMDASGGGLIDILSLGLRIAAWSLGNTRNIIILDEGMKWLSRDLQPRAGEILQEISKKLGIQILMVSHSPDLIACSDKVYEIKQKEGISQALEV
jgi:DNA repair exonuclease SbcCD ATPase subunit